MPISSVEIANLNGVFQQQGMAAQQNAGMIGALGAPSGQGPSFGEHVMGRGVNIGTAIGGPMAAAGLGLAGLDPMSLAMKGAGMGFRAGGIGGAVGMGVGGLAMGAGVGMAASYAVNQMVEGIQQQQQLTRQLQSAYTFQNQTGGTGFNGDQSRQIGSKLSSMQGFAPHGGPMVGFEELSRLASNMGQMNLAGPLRDVKDFAAKFKEGFKAWGEIAHTMQTSIEEAQKLQSDMRMAGVFGPRGAVAFANQIRATAVAANVSTAEVTGMMGVGSQIARMTGGLGKTGARAGIEALANVGAATQVGAINEESIYNVTGLTGAEGRRAFASRMMEQSSKFLRGTQGRYFLASVAGSGGHLDEDSVQEYVAGGVGVEDTRRMANKNLNKVGRADFIRNEGRLRASVMERFGGLETVISMSQWMASRGVSMDDPRARLYLQRARGMGRDEADSMIQMAQNLPQIMEQRKSAAKEDEISRQIAEARSHIGVEGLKRKIEDARNSVQKKLAEPARALFQAGSDMINDFVGQLTGEFTAVQYRHLDELTRAAKGLGAGGNIARQQLTGDIGKSAGMRSLARGAIGELRGDAPGALDNFMRDDAERFRDAGFGVHATSDQGLASQLRGIQQIGAGAKAGMGDNDATAKAGSAFGKALAGQIQVSAALRGTGEGFATISNFERTLKEAAAGGSAQAKRTLAGWGKMDQKAKSEFVTAAYRGAGMDVSGLLSAPERNELMGLRAGPSGALHERVGGDLLPGSQGIMGRIAEFFGRGSTTGQTSRAIGDVMDTEEFMNLGKKMLGTNDLLRAGTRKDVTSEMAGLQNSISKDTASTQERARYQALGGLLATQSIDDAMAKAGVKRPEDLPPGEMDKLVKKFGALGVSSREDLIKMARTTAGFMALKTDEQYRQWSSNVTESSEKRMDTLRAGGMMDSHGRLTDAGKKMLGGMGGAGGKFMQAFLGSAQAGIHAGDDRAMGERFLKAEQAQTQAIADMSISDMSALEQKLSSVSPEAARMIRAERSGRQRLEMGRARGGQAGGLKMVAGMFGESVSNEDLRGAMRGGGKGIGALAESLVEGSGATGDSKKELSAALQSYLKGEKGGAGKLQGLIEGNQEIAASKQKKSLAEATDANPLQAAANKSLESIDKKLDDLKTIKTSTSDTAELTRSKKEASTE